MPRSTWDRKEFETRAPFSTCLSVRPFCFLSVRKYTPNFSMLEY